jgi:hypothetical protein
MRETSDGIVPFVHADSIQGLEIAGACMGGSFHKHEGPRNTAHILKSTLYVCTFCLCIFIMSIKGREPRHTFSKAPIIATFSVNVLIGTDV